MRYAPVHLAARLLLLALVSACSTLPAWTPRSTPACVTSTGDLELDRERTYLAALLALNTRHYAILYADAPRQIEAAFSSDYKPERSKTRWILTIQPDASLRIDTPDDQRKTHKKTESWYDKLLHSVQLLQCRDLNWLRWEAQNRGLMSVGAAPDAPPAPVLPAAPSAQGGEAPVTLAPAPGPYVSPALDPASAARLAELERERAALHVGRSITWAASGIGVAITGFGMLYGAILYDLTESCPSSSGLDADDPGNCPMTRATLAIAITGGTLLAAGGTMFGVALPRVFSKLRTSRSLSREIKLLRGARFTPGTPLSRLGFTFSRSF